MVVTFLGTKGGTGTTTMAVNCAADVRRLSHRATLIVDVKQGPGDVAVFLGLRARHSLVDFIDQVGWSDRTLASRFVSEHECGVHVLAAPETFGRPNSRDADGVDQALRSLTSKYEHLVIDAGSTLTSCTVAALGVSDLVMLVANPDVPCLRNLQRLTDALRLAGVGAERVRVILNRTSDHGALPASQIETAIGRTIDFQVPSDYRTVASAVNAGVPVSSLRSTDLHLQLDAMSRTLLGTTLVAAVTF